MAETEQIDIPRVKLNNGIYMPVLGYGTWLGLNDKAEFEMTDCLKMQDCLSYAMDIGYRHIDTAHLYRVEPEVGQAIRMKIKEGRVKREDLFVTTKVWHHYHRPEDVLVSCKGSLRRLDLKYVDQLLMHWPMSINQKGVDENIDYLETWKGFEAVYDMGLAKSIGVSNFNIDQLKRLVANCTVKPAANQVEINLNLGQTELVDYCKSEDIAVVAYSPFGTMVPSRSTKGSPEPKLENPTMVHIGKRYGKTVTQITLRYLYQRGIISIPKTVTKARVLENANIFDFNLYDDDMAEISKFDVNYRTVRPVFWQECNNYPFDKIQMEELPQIPDALKKWKNGLRGDIS